MSTRDDILRNCDEMRMEITLAESRGGGHSGSLRYLISHWKIWRSQCTEISMSSHDSEPLRYLH